MIRFRASSGPDQDDTGRSSSPRGRVQSAVVPLQRKDRQPGLRIAGCRFLRWEIPHNGMVRATVIRSCGDTRTIAPNESASLFEREGGDRAMLNRLIPAGLGRRCELPGQHLMRPGRHPLPVSAGGLCVVMGVVRNQQAQICTAGDCPEGRIALLYVKWSLIGQPDPRRGNQCHGETGQRRFHLGKRNGASRWGNPLCVQPEQALAQTYEDPPLSAMVPVRLKWIGAPHTRQTRRIFLRHPCS